MSGFGTSPLKHPLVVEHNIRPPDELGGDSDGGDILKLLRVPAQLVIAPFLSGHIHSRQCSESAGMTG